MQKQKSRSSLLSKLRVLAVFVAVAGLVGGGVVVHADQYDDQINALQQKNSANQSLVNSLASQASSYQGALSQLQSQIDAVQAALAINQAKQVSLQQQIAADQAKAVQLKGFLGDDIKTMYVDGQLTTIEELATSKNLSDYVDKEEYRTTVQDKVDDLIQQIANVETQLQSQNTELNLVISTQAQQNSQLAATQAQQQSLLNYNQSQQDSFNSQIQSNQSQISALKVEQAAANRKIGGGGVVTDGGTCGGSYPTSANSPAGGHWGCDYAQDNTIDNWGMDNRECVSYTAWMVYQTYGYMPYWGGSGNANEWPANARAAGIPTGSVPKAGSVAIATTGAFGHAMWVDSVSGNEIHVQQYNYDLNGQYSEMTIDGSGLTYIYFGG